MRQRRKALAADRRRARSGTLLTPDEEARLSRLVLAGGKAGLDARNKLVEANLPLAGWFARQYTASGMDQQDVLQECRLAFIEAADTFDATRGRFASYCKFFVRRRLQYARSRDAAVPTPVHGFELVAPYCRAFDAVAGRLGRIPTVDEVAAELGWSQTTTMTASAAADTRRRTISIERIRDDNERAILAPDSLSVDGDDEPLAATRARQMDAVSQVFARLDRLHRVVIAAFLRGDSIEQIAAVRRLSPAEVLAMIEEVREWVHYEHGLSGGTSVPII